DRPTPKDPQSRTPDKPHKPSCSAAPWRAWLLPPLDHLPNESHGAYVRGPHAPWTPDSYAAPAYGRIQKDHSQAPAWHPESSAPQKPAKPEFPSKPPALSPVPAHAPWD